MGLSLYQGYIPVTRNNIMTLYYPLRSNRCTGEITVDLELNDPNVFLLSAPVKEVTVSPRDGLYPVQLTLPLERSRRNGDYPATLTVTGRDAQGNPLTQSIPYVISIRDGQPNPEGLTPVLADITGELIPGETGYVYFALQNPASTLTLPAGTLTLKDAAGEILMTPTDSLSYPEVLPGEAVRITVPVRLQANAAISLHRLELTLSYRLLGVDTRFTETLTLPVNQEIRLEQGDLPPLSATAGELSDLLLPIMNMGRGEVRNLLLTLDTPGLGSAPSVLLGSLGAGESLQAKLTFTPDAPGEYPATLRITCEDAYGNAFSRELTVSLTVLSPVEEEKSPTGQEEAPNRQGKTGLYLVSALCVLLTLALIVQGALLRGKLRQLEESRL